MELLNGDCLELMKNIPTGSIDMILCDPPYGTTKCKWDTVIPFGPMWRQLERIIKDDGVVCLFGTEPFSSHLRLSNLKMFKYDWTWHKNRASNIFLAKKMPLRVTENVSVFMPGSSFYYPQYIELTKAGKSRNTRANNPKIRKGEQYLGSISFSKDRKNKTHGYPRNILNFKLEQNNQYKKNVFHSTQKPVLLLEYLVKTYTIESEIVLDFAMGGGSTGIACKNLNRKFIGMELDDKYFEIAKERIENHIPKDTVKDLQCSDR